MDQSEGLNIFYEEKQPETLHEHNDKDEPLPVSVPYLKRGDSSMYLEQFLEKNEEPEEVKQISEPLKKEEAPSNSKDEDY